MAKSDSTDPVLDFESEGAPVEVDPATSELPVADNPVGPEVETPEAPPVEVKLSSDFTEDVGDGVYANIAFPGDAADEDGRIKLSDSATSYPAVVAAQLAELPAVEVVE